MGGKKVNPRRVPVKLSQADIDKMVDKATNDAMDTMLNMAMYVLRDKFGFDRDWMSKFYFCYNRLASEISEGRVKMKEIKAVLKDEYDIEVVIE